MTDALREIRDTRRAAREDRQDSGEHSKHGGKSFGDLAGRIWDGEIRRKDSPPRLNPDDEAENTYGLPEGTDIEKLLKRFFAEQAEHVLGTIPTIGQPLPDDLPALAAYDQPMTEAFTPLISAYWDHAGQQIREKIGLEPDAWPGSWDVKDPHLQERIQGATFNFCQATNATTTKSLGDALSTLRMELIEGIVTHGESLDVLTERVQGIFTNAEEWRARRIAATETSRAVHEAQYASVEESGVVQGLEILVSSNACPLCQKLAAEVKQVALGQEIAVIGHHPDYSHIKTAPFHPMCRCSCLWVLSPEFGGPENPEWGQTLIQPKAADDYEPPSGVAEAKPKPDAEQPRAIPRQQELPLREPRVEQPPAEEPVVVIPGSQTPSEGEVILPRSEPLGTEPVKPARIDRPKPKPTVTQPTVTRPKPHKPLSNKPTSRPIPDEDDLAVIQPLIIDPGIETLPESIPPRPAKPPRKPNGR